MNRLIVGCGYLGQKVVLELQKQGLSAIGLVRSEESVKALEQQGIVAVQANLDDVDPPPLPLAGAELFYFAPPPRRGVEDSRVAHLLAACDRQGAPRRIVYLSTTGVYGDCGGDWVDETRPVHPVVERALRRRDAEQRFHQWCQTRPTELVILRVAGIYGPGKLPLERLRKGLPMVREEEAPYTNRIHIDDLVQICLAAMVRGGSGEIYNVSDGHPGNMTDYFNRIADRAGLPRPPLISLADGSGRLSAGMMSYMCESRRLDNRKMLRELGVVLRHESLESGLDFLDSAL
ncbi:MAG: SDR family oxidoreductase [Sedimenticola sp.]